MRAFLISVVLGLVFLSVAAAGEEELAGNWKVTMLEKAASIESTQLTFWLLRVESKGGKLDATVDTIKSDRLAIPATTVEGLSAKGDLLKFDLKLKNGPTFKFEGKLPRAGAKKIQGSFSQGSLIVPVILEATTAKTFHDADRELLARSPNDPRVFNAALDLIGQAKERKTPVKDVQEWVDTALRAAENYGPRWQFEYSVKIVEALVREQDYAAAALEPAQKLEKILDSKAPLDTQLRALTVLAAALKANKQSERLADVESRVDKLEAAAYAAHQAESATLKVDKFSGRKAKSNRTVLVELFTGAQCPPCVGADMAFDALEKAYKPSEVVLLQYHLHIPRPDALTNEDTEARQIYYGKAIRGTPTILFNGLPDAPGGAGAEDAPQKLKEYTGVVNPLLEKPAAAQVEVSAVRKGDKVQIKALVDGVDKPSEKVRLRLALVEDWVRYRGANGLSYHHRVVRALPGGAKGFALNKKDAEHNVAVDLGDLRDKLGKYLDDFAKSEDGPFPDAQRPMRLRHLSVVAFVQNDDTREVLQAMSVAVKND